MIRKLSLFVLFMALGTVVALAATIDGKWNAAINTPMGARNYSFEFHVEGNNLTGKAVDEQGNATEIKEGKIDGDNVSFVEEHNGDMGSIRIVYNGKLNGDEIKFTRKVGDFGTDDFAATRSK